MSRWYDDGEYYYDDFYDDDDDFDCGDDHESPSDAIIIEGPIRALSKRGDIGTEWWGKQWVAAVESFYHDDRLKRGRTYARNGSVKNLEISHGAAFARVQGSRQFPYCTEIKLNPFTTEEWQHALASLAGQAIYSAKLLAGEMPADIESVFQSVGLSLFPRSLEDIFFECSCPDYGNPCKHAAAVYYLLAEQIDSDPFVLFHLRGRTRDQVLMALRGHRSASVSPSAETGEATAAPQAPALDVHTFWSSPPLNLIHSAPVTPKQPPFLVQLGNPPDGIGKDLRKIYEDVASEAREWLERDTYEDK
jgi:uncharacterized Zn finger protein